MSFFIVYLMLMLTELNSRIYSLNKVMVPIAVLLIGMWLFYMIITYVEPDHRTFHKVGPGLSKVTKWYAGVAAVLLVLYMITPTKQTAYLMIGGYAVTNVEGIKELPANVVGAANHFLKEYQASQKSEVVGSGAKGNAL